MLCDPYSLKQLIRYSPNHFQPVNSGIYDDIVYLCSTIRERFNLEAPINESTEYTPISPYECIYVPYTKELENLGLFWCPPGMNHPFRSSIRLKLLAMMIDKELSESEEILPLKLRVRKHIAQGNILAFFPLHNPHIQMHLSKDWLRWRWPWRMPLFQIREYYGEKIALSVALMSHYTTWLAIPAVASIPVTAIIFIDNMDYRSPLIPAFSFLLALWAIVMLEFWKRKEKYLALVWGTTGYEAAEQERPEFFGEEIVSFIDGSTIKFFPPAEYRWGFFRSCAAVFALLCMDIGVVVAIYVFRYHLYAKIGQDAIYVAAGLNAIQIIIMNPVYMSISAWLTEKENNRTGNCKSVYAIICCFKSTNYLR